MNTRQRIKRKLNQQSRPITFRYWHGLLAGFLAILLFYLGVTYGYFVLPWLEEMQRPTEKRMEHD